MVQLFAVMFEQVVKVFFIGFLTVVAGFIGRLVKTMSVNVADQFVTGLI